MGWACAQTVIYNAFRLQKKAKKSHKDYTGTPTPQAAAAPAESVVSLSRSLSTDDSGSENNSSVFNQDEDMQSEIEAMDKQPRESQCPCGCPGMKHHELDAIKIRTKEIVGRHGPSYDFTDRVFGAEVLRYRGKNYCHEEIAPTWKKDCRSWLWKSLDQMKARQGARDSNVAARTQR